MEAKLFGAFARGLALSTFLVPVLLASRAAAQPSCPTELWPDTDLRAILEGSEFESALMQAAERALREAPAAVETLRSAGVTNKDDPRLVRSRRAFRDADFAAISALAYVHSGEKRYLSHSRRLLLAWARINLPTGHPIDETRLEGLAWAYALLCPQLPDGERSAVQRYFQRMYQAKKAWKFGPKTSLNNHRTHQLKMLILLDRVLDQPEALQQDTQAARDHLLRNIDAASGISRDYRERDALYYHVYNLEAWLEIQLLTGCCVGPLAASLDFLAQRIVRGETSGEFAASSADIDRKRAKAGFAYAGRSDYDLSRAARVLLVWSTLTSAPLPGELWEKVNPDLNDSRLLFFRARREIWRSH